MSAAACHRPEPDLHIVEATGNTIICALSSGTVSLQSSCDNDATGNENDHSDCSETTDVTWEILTEVVSLGRARSVWPAGHLHREEFAPS